MVVVNEIAALNRFIESISEPCVPDLATGASSTSVYSELEDFKKYEFQSIRQFLRRKELVT